MIGCSVMIQPYPRAAAAVSLHMLGIRFMNALFWVQELDEAIECFTKAQELDSSDLAIPKELAKAKQARLAAEKKQRATYAKMFG